MYWDYGYFKPTKRRNVKGGIKLQSRAGGKNWWSKKWIDALTSVSVSSRLSRGRSYARSGQVLSVDIKSGVINSRVQGSRRSPYAVTIEIKPLTAHQWKTIGKAIGSKAAYVAHLLNGEMPETIEEVFRSASISLFPQTSNDLKTDCSCPDWSNPCKHIAAVYYIVGEEFDRDPFLLFKLRGLEREALLNLISEFQRGSASSGAVGKKISQKSKKTKSSQTASVLPADPTSFWGTPLPMPGISIPYEVPHMHGAHVRLLGNFPFWRGAENFVDSVTTLYPAASEFAVAILATEQPEPPAE
jgi:uncharacterized Zn finger protein